MRDRRDTSTPDIFSWVPPAITSPVPEQLRLGSLRTKLARMVSLVLNEAEEPIDEIAKRMAEFLEEEVSVHTLRQCASQAREDHTLSAIRCAALAHATGDHRIMQLLMEPLGLSAIPNRYLPAIEAEIKADRAEELTRAADQLRLEATAARRDWKGRR
jgi:hypothetical protein